MTDKLYDQLPLEVAQALHWVEAWHANTTAGRTACADSDLAVLAAVAHELVDWKARQDNDARVTLPQVDITPFRTQRPTIPKTPPKLRVVPRLPGTDRTKD